MTQITDPFLVGSDRSDVPNAIANSGQGKGRGFGVLSSIMVPTIDSLGSSLLKAPKVFQLNGGLAVAPLVDTNTPPAGKLWVVTHAAAWHDDATARNLFLQLRSSFSGTTVDMVLAQQYNAAAYVTAFLPKTIVLVNGEYMTANAQGLGGAAHAYLQYRVIELTIGEYYEPSI